MTKDRKTKEPKLNLRNWECGIIFPAGAAGLFGRSEAQFQTTETSDQGVPSWGAFKGKIPIPMLVPEVGGVGSTLEYGDRKPWFFS